MGLFSIVVYSSWRFQAWQKWRSGILWWSTREKGSSFLWNYCQKNVSLLLLWLDAWLGFRQKNCENWINILLVPLLPVLFDIKIIWNSLFVIKLSVCRKCYCNNVILKEPSRPHFSFLALARYPCDCEENKKGKSEALLQEGGKWCGNHNNQGISMSWSC